MKDPSRSTTPRSTTPPHRRPPTSSPPSTSRAQPGRCCASGIVLPSPTTGAISRSHPTAVPGTGSTQSPAPTHRGPSTPSISHPGKRPPTFASASPSQPAAAMSTRAGTSTTCRLPSTSAAPSACPSSTTWSPAPATGWSLPGSRLPTTRTAAPPSALSLPQGVMLSSTEHVMVLGGDLDLSSTVDPQLTYWIRGAAHLSRRLPGPGLHRRRHRLDHSSQHRDRRVHHPRVAALPGLSGHLPPERRQDPLPREPGQHLCRR